jgi:hypothetical protein
MCPRTLPDWTLTDTFPNRISVNIGMGSLGLQHSFLTVGHVTLNWAHMLQWAVPFQWNLKDFVEVTHLVSFNSRAGNP